MSRLQRALLLALLLAAALLRGVGLDQDLRRGAPTPDEWTNFVGPVLRMWEARSLDPAVNGGYPGLFNWIVLLPMGLGARLGGEAGACLAGRVVVAAFSVLNVLLLFRLVRPDYGTGAALLGAALLAFSRSEVSEGRFLTPDVLVVTAFLLMLLAARREPAAEAGPRALRRDVLPGLCAGLAIAVKYSGVLLLPALAAEYAARRRLQRLLPAAAAVAVGFALAAPFALLWRRNQARGLDELLVYYFGPLLSGRLLLTMARQAREVFGWMSTNLGGAALLLAALCVLARPRRPLAAPAAALLASFLVLSLTGQVYPRHVLLASTAATLLAAAGWSALVARVGRGRGAQAILAALVLVVPAGRALAVARGYAQQTDLDRAAAFIEAQAEPARVATSLGRLRLSGAREVRAALSLWDLPPSALAEFDLVLAPRDVAARLTGLRVEQSYAPPGSPEAALDVLRPVAPLPAPWPPPARADGNAPGAERAWDGRLDTAWSAPEGAGWVEAAWPQARAVQIVEVVVPEGEGAWPQRLSLSARRSGGPWAPLPVVTLRPGRSRLQQPPHGQVYAVTEPVTIDALRIERKPGAAWALAEVRLRGPEGDGHDER
jgi:4-amino-4-deoxy-L-arabinose transferase-like glycosyltransferase